MSVPKRSYKIAILNCYLQGGHTETAEVESAKRFQIAARNLGHAAESFARTEDLYSYSPDIVVAQAYQDAKLSDFPTYGLLTMPPSWVRSSPRFLRNIMSYDGYLTLSESVVTFVDEIGARLGKGITPVYSAFSVPRTPFVSINFQSAFAAYLGTNWDGKRHGGFFDEFVGSDTLRCFGPEKNWKSVDSGVYGGPVPFDGQTVLNVYRRAGIGLGLNHPDFDQEGIPTSRTFEIPASSALLIAGSNSLVRSIYGDAAFYIDTERRSKSEMAVELRDRVRWVRSHSSVAAEMARESNRIFNEKLAMEMLLGNLIKEHQRANINRGSSPEDRIGISSAGDQITVICNQSNKLETQISAIAGSRAVPSEIVVRTRKKGLFDILRRDPVERVAKRYPALSIVRAAEHSASELASLREILRRVRTPYVSILRSDAVPYPAHYEGALRASDGKVAVYSGVVEVSQDEELAEIIRDDSLVPRHERRRLVQFSSLQSEDVRDGERSPIVESVLFPTALLREVIAEVDSMSELLTAVGKRRGFRFVPNVSLEIDFEPGGRDYLPFFYDGMA